MAEKNILVEKNEGIGWLTVNRPDSLNALNSVTIDALQVALQELGEDEKVKVVVITGAGEKAFIAGGDIKEMATMTPLEARAYVRKGQKLGLTIENMPKPVIAAINGYALGGGLEMALACDFIYASENAKLGLPETTLGVIPGFGGTQNLPRLIGPNKAREMIYTGRILSAQQAKDWGLVNEVVPQAELKAKVSETAASIVCNGSLAIASAKDLVVNGLNMSKIDGLRYENTQFGILFSTEDQKEGMQAFIVKRKAEFKGK